MNGLLSRSAGKADLVHTISFLAAVLCFQNPGGATAQDSPIAEHGIEAVERALSSLDMDQKFAALAIVQRGLVKDVVHAEVFFKDAANGQGPSIILGSAFAVAQNAEVTKSKCMEVNRELQRWILGGLWRNVPNNDLPAIDRGERSAEAVRKRGLPIDMQVRGLIRRFRGYSYDEATDLALSNQEIWEMRQKYVPVYNLLSFRVSLLGASNTENDEPIWVACNNHDNSE